MNEITDVEFDKIRAYIKQKTGMSMGPEKKSLVFSRLRATLIRGNFANFTEYFDYLVKDKSGDALVHFIDRVTTNHTFFMRETDHFDYLRSEVLPIIEKKEGQKDVRLWCAACSSGEEPVTLQIILSEYFAGKGWNTEILATDLSTQALDRAVSGIYSDERVKTLPDEWRKKYFKAIDDKNYKVSDDIKNKIVYRRHNLIEAAFSFKKQMQIIFCRNVMIYFDNETRDKTVAKFYDVLAPGGYLFIGHSESLTHSDTNFKYVKPAVYKKE